MPETHFALAPAVPELIPNELTREFDALPDKLDALSELGGTSLRLYDIPEQRSDELGGVMGDDDEPSELGDDDPTKDPGEGGRVPAHTLPDPEDDDD